VTVPARSVGATGAVVAVCRAAGLHPDDRAVGTTAIEKRAVDGPVPARALGLRGDVQTDRVHHGGADKAVYALDEAEAEHRAAAPGREIPPGLFGENLRIAGLAIDDAEVGERWAVGETLVLEVTGPRTPCAAFGRWLGEPGWVRRYTERARPGVHLRVHAPGTLAADDAVRVPHAPGHGVRVGALVRGATPVGARAVVDAAARGTLELAEYLRGSLTAAASRATA
jgi:MOSC domain-containing protein YiiM